MNTEPEPRSTQHDGESAVVAELFGVGFLDARKIGRGGFGVVYRCTQAAPHRIVAVKVLTTELDEEIQARWFREERAVVRLNGHPNVVDVLDFGVTESGLLYIVMPYFSKGSLDARIRRDGALPLDETLRFGVKVAGVVESAHRLGIAHHDIKPSNILLNDHGEPALADFGTVHILRGCERATSANSGSTAFVEPEVISGSSPISALDIYGLGATLFCALTGYAASEDRDRQQFVAFPSSGDLRKHGIPESLSTVIERAMSGGSRDRQGSASALGDDLRKIQRCLGFPVETMSLNSTYARKENEQVRDSRRSERARMRPRSSNPNLSWTAKGNLPLELTSFIGRRRELTDAKDQLASTRLLTLTGTGGVGKTRLALRVARSVQRGFADGVWLVELGELEDEALLVDVVAGALGLREQSTRRVSEVLTEFLATRELLLVFDNCEQIIVAVADLTAMLLHRCPGLRILATSREPLGIGGETTLRVPPLTAPDPDWQPSWRGLPQYESVALFTARAASAVPTFAVTNRNEITVARICHLLDGLPLPVELAAARLRAMSPEQILRRLNDRYALLTRGDRKAPPRQQTLRWCIDWSHELCSEQEQRLWSRLTVFAGSFELDAAQHVCADNLLPDDLLDTLASLVDKSILIREEQVGIVRFRLLETLRDYGREKSEQGGDYLDMRCRHRDWFCQLVFDAECDWFSARQLDWIARLRREQSNLREALEFCLIESPGIGLQMATALFPFWDAQGLFSEGRRWLDEHLKRHAEQSPLDRIKALCVDSELADVQGDLETSAALVDEARALAQCTDDAATHALILRCEGLLALFSGDLVVARTQFERALEYSSKMSDLSFQIGVLHELGMVYERIGQSDLALNCLNQLLVTTQTSGDSVYTSYSLSALAVAAWRRGDRDETLGLVERALRLTWKVNDPLTAALCLETFAWIAAAAGKMRRAAVLMASAEALGKVVGSSMALFPHVEDLHEECARTTRRALGVRAFDTAYREGYAYDFSASIAYALDEHTAELGPRAEGRTAKILTKREGEVAELVAEGLTNKAIAARLVISQRTAQGHVEHILTKLGFTSRAQIAAWVVDQKE